MIRLTDDEVTAAVQVLRHSLQQTTNCTVDAMMVCLATAATFAVDGCKDADESARRMQIASDVIARNVRRGEFSVGRRLDS